MLENTHRVKITHENILCTHLHEVETVAEKIPEFFRNYNVTEIISAETGELLFYTRENDPENYDTPYMSELLADFLAGEAMTFKLFYNLHREVCDNFDACATFKEMYNRAIVKPGIKDKMSEPLRKLVRCAVFMHEVDYGLFLSLLQEAPELEPGVLLCYLDMNFIPMSESLIKYGKVLGEFA